MCYNINRQKVNENIAEKGRFFLWLLILSPLKAW